MSEKVVEVLRHVEWGGNLRFCPSCYKWKSEGHAAGCKLDALLVDEVEKEEVMTKRYWISEEQLEQISKALRTQALYLHDRLDACDLLCLIRHQQRAVLGTSTLAATKKIVNTPWKFAGWTDKIGLVKLNTALCDLRDAFATELAGDK